MAEPFCNLESFSNSLLTFFCWFRSLVVELEQKRKGEKREHGVGAIVQLGMNGPDTGWGMGKGACLCGVILP